MAEEGQAHAALGKRRGGKGGGHDLRRRLRDRVALGLRRARAAGDQHRKHADSNPEPARRPIIACSPPATRRPWGRDLGTTSSTP